MTTATLPRRLIRPVASHPARRSMLAGLGLGLAAGLLTIAGVSVAIAAAAGSTVLGGVSVGGVELAGLDRAAAGERLGEALPAIHVGAATVAVAETEVVVTYADLGRRYETGAMLDAALGVGRGGNPLTDGIDRLRSLVHRVELPVLVHAYDPAALADASAAIAADVSHPPTEAHVARDGAAFSVSAGSDGMTLAADEVAAAIGSALPGTDPRDVRIELTATPVRPIVDTAMAEAAAAEASAMAADLELTIPGAAQDEVPLALTAETIAAAISFGPEAAEPYVARLDAAAVSAAVAALAGEIDRDPVNARIAVADGGGLGGVIPGQQGRELDVGASANAIVEALRERAGGANVGSLGLAVSATDPALTTSALEAIRPRMEMISSWTTYYVPGEGNGFGANINIPAVDIDGRNLAPGEWFSFWGSIGPVTVERGYTYGGAIINGRSTQGVALAGGICSTSTTIFNAALRAGLEMGDRLNHFYYIDRYPDGLDATVSIMDGWTQDMTFRNDTENPIVIRGFGGNGSVTFQVWSVPLDRRIVITDPVTSNHRRASDTTVVDRSMAPGTSRRVEYPHDGHDVSRSRLVYDASGNLLHRNDYFSSYATVNGIVAVGPSSGGQADEGDAAVAGEGEAAGIGDPGSDEQP